MRSEYQGRPLHSLRAAALNHKHARPTTIGSRSATHAERLLTPHRAVVYPSRRHSAPCAERLRTVCRHVPHHAPTRFAHYADVLRTLCRCASHAMPIRSAPCAERISLTFRPILP
ncbi:MAG: hypothetical protein K2K03_04145 [Prevotella sp.]|nr:hypothetical protein [Prevotella sp.]